MMTEKEIRARRLALLGHLPEVLKMCAGRFYALPGTPEEIALCALLAAWQSERDASFTREEAADFLRQLEPYCGSLFQNRPAPEPDSEKLKQLLEQFRDPITGELPKNPWAKDGNLTERMLVEREFPELASYLRSIASGTTFSVVKKQRDEKAQRDRLRAITYGADEHRKNPYRTGASLTALSEFRARVGDDVANFWQREAREPIVLPWLPGEDGKPRNLTMMMRMQRENPTLRATIDKSLATAREWAQIDVEENERTAAEAFSRATTARTILGGAK